MNEQLGIGVSLPEGYSPTNLRKLLRHVLKYTPEGAWETGPSELLGTSRSSPTLSLPLAAYYLDLLSEYVADGSTQDTRHARMELLRALSHSKKKRDELYVAGCEAAMTSVEVLLGEYITEREEQGLQLARSRCWVNPSMRLESAELVRARLEAQRIDLLSQGFVEVDSRDYANLVAPLLLQRAIRRPEALGDEARMIAHLTVEPGRQKEFGRVVSQVTAELVQKALSGHLDSLQEEHPTRVPQSLFGLAVDARTLGSFYVGLKKDEEFVRDATSVLRTERMPGAGLEYEVLEAATPDESRALATFTELGQLESHHVELAFDTGPESVLGALFKAMEQMKINQNVLEHVPRVVAGMFNAALLDMHRTHLVDRGSFLDTPDGSRLCRIVGFNPENPGHRERIGAVCKLLETLSFHHEFRIARRDRLEHVTISERILEARSRRVEVAVEIDGKRFAADEMRVWSISREMWRLVDPGGEDRLSFFMALDNRAFRLDDSQSIAFNLFWALVQRAYALRVGRDGHMRARLKEVIYWAGLRHKYPRPVQLRKALRKELDVCVDNELIVSWECPNLDGARTFDQLEELTLEVHFGNLQSRHFPQLD